MNPRQSKLGVSTVTRIIVLNLFLDCDMVEEGLELLFLSQTTTIFLRWLYFFLRTTISLIRENLHAQDKAFSSKTLASRVTLSNVPTAEPLESEI